MEDGLRSAVKKQYTDGGSGRFYAAIPDIQERTIYYSRAYENSGLTHTHLCALGCGGAILETSFFEKVLSKNSKLTLVDFSDEMLAEAKVRSELASNNVDCLLVDFREVILNDSLTENLDQRFLESTLFSFIGRTLGNFSELEFSEMISRISTVGDLIFDVYTIENSEDVGRFYSRMNHAAISAKEFFLGGLSDEMNQSPVLTEFKETNKYIECLFYACRNSQIDRDIETSPVESEKIPLHRITAYYADAVLEILRDAGAVVLSSESMTVLDARTRIYVTTKA